MHKTIREIQLRGWFAGLAGLFLCLFLAVSLNAQQGKGSVSGAVLDGSKSIAGATVLAFNVDTGDAFETKSGPKGLYEFKDLAVGTYQLTVGAEGFKLFESEDLKVEARKVTKADIKLVAQEADPRE